MNKILLSAILTFSLTGCLNYDNGKTGDPTGGGSPTGKIGEVAELNLESGSGQVGLINQALNQFSIKVRDSKNRVIPNQPLTIKVKDSTNTVVHSETITADSTGLAGFTYSPNIFGNITVVVDVPGNSSNISELSVPVIVIGPPSTVEIVSGDTQSLSAGSSLGAITYRVKDSNGRTVPSANITVGVQTLTTNSSGLATLTPSSTPTISGNYTLSASITSGAIATASYSVVASSPANISITSGDSQTITAGGSLSNWVIRITDTYGNPVENVVVNRGLSVGLTDTNGEVSFVPSVSTTTAGTYTLSVNATLSGLSDTIDYTITPATASSLSIVSGNNQTITAGASLGALKVKLTDAYLNPISGSVISFGGSSETTNASGEATHSAGVKTASGAFSITASIGGLSQTFNYTVNPNVPATLTIVSGNNQTITAGASLGALKVKVVDTYGNNISGDTVSFGGSSETTNASGEATHSAGIKTASGTSSIVASIGGLSQTFNYTVNPDIPATVVKVSGDSQTLARLQTSNTLSLRVEDQYGNYIPSQAVSWNEASGWTASTTTDSSGLSSTTFSAPNSVGAKTITATAGGASNSFSLTVADYTPSTATASSSSTLAYSELVSDNSDSSSFGNGLAFSPGTTTVLTAGTGTKSGTGSSATASVSVGTSLGITATDITNGNDTITVSTTATFPAGVSSSSCSQQITTGLASITCAVNNSFTFTRDKLLGGLFSFKINSLSSGGSLDYLNTNSLTSQKITVRKTTFMNLNNAQVYILGADSSNEIIFLAGNDSGAYRLFEYDINNGALTKVASNITVQIAYPSASKFFNNKLYFSGLNPDDSNNNKILVYDGTNIVEAFRVVAGGESSIISIISGSDLWFTNSARLGVKVNSSGVASRPFAGAVGTGWIPFGTVNGQIVGGGTTLNTQLMSFNGTNLTLISNATGSVNYTSEDSFAISGGVLVYRGLVSSNTKLMRWDGTSLTQISNFNSAGADQLGSLISFGGEVYFNAHNGTNWKYYKITSTGHLRQLADFTSGGDDISPSSIRPFMAVYNNKLYLSAYISGSNRLIQYDGTNTYNLGAFGCADNTYLRSEILDNALFYTCGRVVYRVCDVSAGCTP